MGIPFDIQNLFQHVVRNPLTNENIHDFYDL